MSHVWTGVFPAVTTKFKDDFSLDREEMIRSFQLQMDAGVDGFITTGSLGEASSLTIDEKVEVLKIAKEVAKGKVPVLGTVAEDSTAKAIEFAQKAEAAGADGFMVLPGMRYIADVREAVYHYQSVANAVSKPLMIYNNPVAYGTDLGEEGVAELLKDPKFVALKESSDDIRRTTTLRNRFGDRMAIFTGVDNLAMEALVMGADGWVAGLVVAFPKETVAIYKLVKAGRIAEAREIYRWFIPLLNLDVSTKLVQNIKLVEKLACGSTETVRAPRLPLIGEQRAYVEKVVADALAKRPTLPTDI